MKRRRFLWLGLVAAAVAGLAIREAWLRYGRAAGAPVRTADVIAGPMTVWTSYEGVLEARQMNRIVAQVDGSAVLIELAPEGTRVRAGDVLARFDVTEAESDLTRLFHERVRAEQEAIGLREAELPLERLDLEAQVFEARYALESEARFLDASRELAERGLVSEEEVERQSARVAGLRARRAQAETRLALTIEHVHPARLARAEASLAWVDAQIGRVQRRIGHGVIRAPGDGVVVHLPLPLGGAFRAAHVGDTIHRNQAFMALPDLSDVVVRFRIPESDLPRVSSGHPVRVRPVAYPDRSLAGQVTGISAMAQSQPGESAWQKGFSVLASLEDPDPGLPAGITVRVDVQSYHRADAVQVPRLAVRWRDDEAHVRVLTKEGVRERRASLGWAGDTVFEVREGLAPGERVEVP